MRQRGQNYKTLDGLHEDRDAVAWYWRMLAVASSFMLLGGFLMLPSTFDDDPKLRLSKTALGIFAAALLATAFCLTGILSFAVRNPLFQADSIYLPSCTSCSVGLMTVFYDFLISSRYKWTTAATLTTAFAGLGTVVYGALLISAQRRIHLVTKLGPSDGHTEPLRAESYQGSTRNDAWADPSYYQNYVQNMFPAALSPPRQGYDPIQLTEEEQQRQQMLALLMQRNNPRVPTPDTATSTYKLDWQDREPDDSVLTPPQQGFFAPQHPSPGSEEGSAYPTGSSQAGNARNVPSWNGVWRGAGPLPGSGSGSLRPDQSGRRTSSYEERERRRVEIERA